MQRFWASAFLLVAIAYAPPVYANPAAIDAGHSKVTIYVYKAGLFSVFADNHEIDAPIVSGSYDSTMKSVELTLDATQMKVLDPKVAASRRADVQASMAGPQVLDVETFRTIAFRSTNIDDADPVHWTVTGNLTLHGQTHPVTVHVVKLDDLHFRGSATIRQTAFGMTPIRIAGGAVSVKDDVRVDFEIALNP